ncbi:MAG: TolC family protein [Chromatiales bacterium]
MRNGTWPTAGSSIAIVLFLSIISFRSQRPTHIFSILLGFTLLSSLSVPLLAASAPLPYHLEQAIAVALENNHLRTISRQSLTIAEAQYRQAASSYWPSLSLNLGFQRRDEPAIFEYPEQDFDLAPGLLPPVTIPSHEVSLLGRDTRLYSLEMSYPLYTGGKRSSLIEQARLGVDIATQEVRRSNLQVVQDVKRYYYAALYTRQLVELAEDITLSFEVLRDITQTFFEGGSTSVDKLDLLQSKLAYSMAEAAQAELKSNHEAALSALAFTMGLDWREQIALASTSYPANVDTLSQNHLIEQALAFNPELEKLALVVQTYGAMIDEAQSGYYPTLALLGSYDGFSSDRDGGLDNAVNRRSWKIGIGLRMNLFEGGRTRHKIAAAKTEQAKMEQQRLLLSDAIASQVKSLFLQTRAAKKQVEITHQAMVTSRENLDLTRRAYQTGAVETQKVIEANLVDAMIQASNYRAMHDQVLHLAEIAYLLGKEAMQSY